ncbi:uncharacterized protein LOC129296660 [Prosopis cineraria]|uniref:uncharacterized protein LOC129296660 n=1 Tax=Prosopis cineraria TaxID=364024 RepID=UPI00240F1A9C|nr:uncharacterized protein LOC129296660 [Prosopis cineraria]
METKIEGILDEHYNAEPDLVDDIGDLAATYMLPQLLILSSQLNSAGGLRSVYVNFGPKGYYWLNPESWPVNDRREFENLLGGLFENGMIIDPVTDEVLCHKITDLRDNVPANSKLIDIS